MPLSFVFARRLPRQRRRQSYYDYSIVQSELRADDTCQPRFSLSVQTVRYTHNIHPLCLVATVCSSERCYRCCAQAAGCVDDSRRS